MDFISLYPGVVIDRFYCMIKDTNTYNKTKSVDVDKDTHGNLKLFCHLLFDLLWKLENENEDIQVLLYSSFSVMSNDFLFWALYFVPFLELLINRFQILNPCWHFQFYSWVSVQVGSLKIFYVREDFVLLNKSTGCVYLSHWVGDHSTNKLKIIKNITNIKFP